MRDAAEAPQAVGTSGRGVHRTYVIAEAGVNHDGSLAKALELVAAARYAGADAVKFQTFRAEDLTTGTAGRAEYQKHNMGEDGSQRAMLAGLQLSAADHVTLRERCDEVGIEFLSSPFDESSVDLLAQMGLKRFKVPSGELTNLPLLRRVAHVADAVILSTGASWLGEVEAAVRTLADAGVNDLTLLHCVSEYPAPAEQINLRAMTTLEHAFGLPVGYSDHTLGSAVPIAAVAMGAVMIEKHITLDRTSPGPDHAASADPDQFKEMVDGIRAVEAALGDGRKRPMPVEIANRDLVRKSVTTVNAMRAGELFTQGSLTLKRPGTGIAPAELPSLIGRRAARDLEADVTLAWTDVA